MSCEFPGILHRNVGPHHCTHISATFHNNFIIFGAQLRHEDKAIWPSHRSRCNWVHRFLLELWGGGGPARFPAAAPQPPPREAPGDDPLISAVHGLEERCARVSFGSGRWRKLNLMYKVVPDIACLMMALWSVLMWSGYCSCTHSNTSSTDHNDTRFDGSITLKHQQHPEKLRT